MKLFWLILSVYVIFLSVKPCCEDSDCYAKYITKKEQQNKTKGDECPGCSPFYSCGSCGGFVVAKLLTAPITLMAEPLLKHFAYYQHPFIKQVPLSIWQPPQLS